MNNEEFKKQSSLGRDFLTYICYKSDEKAGLFEIPASDLQFSLWVDGKIVMENDSGAPPNTVSYSGDDFTSLELKQAIRSGKKVRDARLRIEKGENTWSFVLRADRLEVSGLKIDMPRTKDNDLDERFYARILSIEALNSLLEELYGYFINQIHGKSWQTSGYSDFQKWLQG